MGISRNVASAALLAGGFLVWAVVSSPTSSTTSSKSNSMKLTPDMAAAMTSGIKQFGYNCPKAKLAFAEGEDHYGTVIKVHCGPADRDGVYENAVFRVTIRSDEKIRVQPWR